MGVFIIVSHVKILNLEGIQETIVLFIGTTDLLMFVLIYFIVNILTTVKQHIPLINLFTSNGSFSIAEHLRCSVSTNWTKLYVDIDC